MSRQRMFVEINISSIPVDGWGGLGLLSLAAVVAVTLPELRLPVLTGLAGGGALAVVLVAFRRWHESSNPGGNSPSLLIRAADNTPQAPEEPEVSPCPPVLLPSCLSPSPDLALRLLVSAQRPIRVAGCEGLFRLNSVLFVVK
jgi:hypothetical protein